MTTEPANHLDSGELKTLSKWNQKVQTAGVILTLLGGLMATEAAIMVYVIVGFSSRPTRVEMQAHVKEYSPTKGEVNRIKDENVRLYERLREQKTSHEKALESVKRAMDAGFSRMERKMERLYYGDDLDTPRKRRRRRK